jgi:hypothetical protein
MLGSARRIISVGHANSAWHKPPFRVFNISSELDRESWLSSNFTADLVTARRVKIQVNAGWSDPVVSHKHKRYSGHDDRRRHADG